VRRLSSRQLAVVTKKQKLPAEFGGLVGWSFCLTI